MSANRVANKPKPQASTLVFSPQDASNATLKYIENAIATRGDGVPMYIKCLDEPSCVLPNNKGDVRVILGRSRNGKTQLMQHVALSRAEVLLRAGLHNRAIIVTSWEQPVEALDAYGIARHTGIVLDQIATATFSEEEVKTVKGYLARRAGQQLWYVGFSKTIQARRPAMTMDVIFEAVEVIRDWNGPNSFVIDMVTLDYLQRIPWFGESKTVGMSANVDATKDLAIQFACPVFLGCQAKQDVEKRLEPIPDADDGQWTDNLVQSTDSILAPVKASLYREPGSTLAGITMDATTLPNIMLINVPKQKMGRSEFIKTILFDTSRCRYLGDVITKEV